MNLTNYILVKHKTTHYRPVIAVSYNNSRIKLGGVADAALPFSLEEAKALHRKLVLFGYDALIWSRKD